MLTRPVMTGDVTPNLRTMVPLRGGDTMMETGHGVSSMAERDDRGMMHLITSPELTLAPNRMMKQRSHTDCKFNTDLEISLFC